MGFCWVNSMVNGQAFLHRQWQWVHIETKKAAWEKEASKLLILSDYAFTDAI